MDGDNPAGGRSRRRLATMLMLLPVVTATSCTAAEPASGLERLATPATFSSVFAAAQGGDSILLGPGDYGRFSGGSKPGMVTISAHPGAHARMDLDFRGASNITINELKLGEITIQEDAKNITVRNSTIIGQTVLRTGTLANANILFDNNHHAAWDKCSSCGEARLFLPERTSQPSGITIQNSQFGPGGNSDGIQNGSNGTRILDNEFVGIKQRDGDEVHADSIQLYGSQNTLVKGNWFHDVSVGVMCPDGCDHETIEDNVFAVNGSPYAVTLLSDNGSTIRHNTFLDYGTCDFDQPCGVLYLGNKSSDAVSRGTIVKDNILTRICVCDGNVSGLAEEDFNLLRSGGNGSHDLRGAPSYAGGANPSGYSGFVLAAGSHGKGTASDGLDRGIRASQGTPTTSAPAKAIMAKAIIGLRVRSNLRQIARTGKLRLAITTGARGAINLRARVRPGRAIGSYRGRHSRRLVTLRTAKLATRGAGTHGVTINVGRHTRRILRRSRSAYLSVRVRVGSQTRTFSKIRITR